MNKVSQRAVETPPPEPGHTVTHFRLEKQLGEGGMGTVFLAQDTTLDRRVAIKFMNRSLITDAEARYPVKSKTLLNEFIDGLAKRFIREAKSAAQISHPNLAQIYEANFDTDQWFIAMEYVDGRPLSGDLAERKSFTVDEIVAICRQTVSALKYAWDNYTIVHRDIKPANIMLTEDGTVKIVDLGLAKPIAEEKRQMPDVTGTGLPLGTPQYMAPEQARGETDIDFKADIYSLGATLYEVATGIRAFEAATPAMMYDAQMRKAYRPIREVRPGIPPRLANLIDWMLEPKLDDRVGSYDKVLTELDRLAPSPRVAWISRDFDRLNKLSCKYLRLDLSEVLPWKEITGFTPLRELSLALLVVGTLVPLVFTWYQPRTPRIIWGLGICLALIWGRVLWRLLASRRPLRKAMLAVLGVAALISLPLGLALLRFDWIAALYSGELDDNTFPSVWKGIFVVAAIEEVVKLVPLAILLLRRSMKRSRLTAQEYLLFGALVGVVFSVKHSMAYSKFLWDVFAFDRPEEVIRMLAFFIAVPVLHACWTGTLAWYFYRARMGERMNWSLLVFGLLLVCVLHGVFSAFAMHWIGLLAAGATILVFGSIVRDCRMPANAAAPTELI